MKKTEQWTEGVRRNLLCAGIRDRLPWIFGTGKAWVDVCGKVKHLRSLPACASEHYCARVLPELPPLLKPCTKNLVLPVPFLDAFLFPGRNRKDGGCLCVPCWYSLDNGLVHTSPTSLLRDLVHTLALTLLSDLRGIL